MHCVPSPLASLSHPYEFRNVCLSLAAGNATIWKPSPSTPLCSIAVTKIVSEVLERNNIPGGLTSLVTGGKSVGAALAESSQVEMGMDRHLLHTENLATENYSVSFTGSEAAGRTVGKVVQSRFGKNILELGGNNGASPLRNVNC
jgi:aldehyde dehydrogenase family 7 protein A1